jgi:N-acetylneuraminate synthase
MKRTLIIAEAGDNHNGSVKMAKKLIDVAVEAGADIVKFQTFCSEEVISRFAPKAEYQTVTTDSDESQLDMVKKLELNADEHKLLVEYCKEKNIEFLSTPFDIPSVKLLVDELHVKMLKIPSGEITSGPLLLKAAQTDKKIILSTGMSTLTEVEQALGVLAFGYLHLHQKPSKELFQQAYCSVAGQSILKEKVQLLHCTTEYPAPYVDVNLAVMDTLRQAFGLPVGLSDHTQGIAVPIAAVSLGACIVEKHFTLDKNLPGPDHKASLEPQELKAMVQAIRQVEQAIGQARKIPAASEMKNKPIARKSLVARYAICKGEILTEDNITFKRPGTGTSPMEFWGIIGKTAQRSYQDDEVID